jgi:hypothetical protein
VKIENVELTTVYVDKELINLLLSKIARLYRKIKSNLARRKEASSMAGLL